MRTRTKALIAASALLLPLVVQAPAVAGPGLSLYIAGSNTATTHTTHNPTPTEMFVLMILYNPGGGLEKRVPTDAEFPGCAGAVIPPWGTARSVWAPLVSSDPGTRTLFKQIAVPTGISEGAALGIVAQGRGNSPRAILPPELFSIHPINLEALTACACAELDDGNQDLDLLEPVGIFCDV